MFLLLFLARSNWRARLVETEHGVRCTHIQKSKFTVRRMLANELRLTSCRSDSEVQLNLKKFPYMEVSVGTEVCVGWSAGDKCVGWEGFDSRTITTAVH